MKNVLEFLEHTAKCYGDKTAVDDGSVCYTFEELKDLAEKIGSRLASQVRPGTAVPVFADKSADTLAVFLGIVEAGCFYVPVNPVQPDFRVKQILDTLDSGILVSIPEPKRETSGIGLFGDTAYDGRAEAD